MEHTGNFAVLYRSAESGAAIVGAMCDDILGEHVDAERAHGGDDDVGGDGDVAAAAADGGAVRGDEKVLQSGGSDGGVRDANRRDEHFDGYGCELDNKWDVESFSRGKGNKLQHMVLLRFPRCSPHSHLFLVHHLPPLSAQRNFSCFVFLFG